MIVTITKIDGKEITFDSEEKPGNILEKEDWVKPEYVKLGEAEIEIRDGKVSFVAMMEDQEANDQKTKKSEKKWEDDIVSFETLLTAAHKKAEKDTYGLNIQTSIIRDTDGKPLINLEKKFAVFKAIVYLTDPTGREIQRFEGHGDATEDNVTGDFIKPHFIRMAETRAIVRALRWYTNNGCAEEEK